MGDLDNTLVFYIWGDNGASMEGTTTGSFNELTFLNGLVLDADQQLELIEKYGGIEALGGDHTAPHIAAAWAHACNTPFQWGKQIAATSAAPATRWSSRGRPASRPTRRCAPSSLTASTSARRSSRLPASRSPRSSTASSRSPWTARASCTRWTTPRRRAPHRPVLRDVRQPRDVQGRLVGGIAARPPPVGPLARRRSRSSAPTRTGIPTATSAGSCTT